jgi:TetR/AcrR family transcriptional regulator
MARTKATPPTVKVQPGKPVKRRAASPHAAKPDKPTDDTPARRRGQGKERILAAALDLFANKGFDAVSTADVAQQAGSSQSVVLYHFGTKDELWRAAMRDLFRTVSIKPTFDGAMYKDLDAVSRLRVLLRGFVLTSARHPELGRVINREGSSSTERMAWLFQELARPNYAVFEALFAEGAKSGLLKSYPAPMLTLLVHGAAATLFNLGSIAQMLLDTDPFTQDVIELQADLVVDIILNGLVTTGSTPIAR